MSSPPCRPHTPWYDGEEPECLRLHSAGSTIPRLWPTGSSARWLPLITTRWFSASPSDPPSREAPCPPKYRTRWLQVPLGCVLLSRSCPFRVLHTCLILRPVRHYPHFWISTWGLRLSGTSTHLTRVLPGTHYEGAKTSRVHPARSVSFAWRYRSCTLGLRSRGCQRPRPRAWDLVSRRVPAGEWERRSTGAPKFLGIPSVHLPCSKTPAGSFLPSQYSRSILPPQPQRRRLLRPALISRLNDTAFALTVYASCRHY